MKIKYLITGAAGNLGSSIIRELITHGAEIRAMVLPGDNAVSKLPAEIEIFEGDIVNKDDTRHFFNVDKGTEIIVIHCAGIITTCLEYVQRIYDVNVTGTRNIVEECVKSKVKKLVYISSVDAIPRPPKGTCALEVTSFNPDNIHSFYGKTKAEASQIVMDAVKRHGLNASLIFPTGLCGPHDVTKGHVTQVLIDSCRGKMPAGIKGGFDFVDVRDVAKGVVSCCNNGRKGEGYILSNRYVSIKEIFHNIHVVTGLKEIKLMVPVWLVQVSVPFMSVYYKLKKQLPIFTSYSLNLLTCNTDYSHQKAVSELGYTVRPFKETISDALAWLKNEGLVKFA